MLYNKPQAQLLLPAARRLLQSAPRPRAMGAVSLQGSGYYICHSICCCSPCAVVQDAPRTGRPQARSGLSRAANRPAAACVQWWRKGRRHDSTVTADSRLHLRLRCLVAAAALRIRRSTGSDKILVGRRLHKQGKLASISEL